MKTKTTNTRRKFATAWDEIGYLYSKLLYWFYNRHLPGRARPYASRLEKLLEQADADQESILGQECRSLISELRQDLKGAIQYREDEIRKIRHLHQLTEKTAQWKHMSRDYGHDALSDQLDLLALLYDQAGDTKKAIRLLEESKEYCNKHGIPFDGQAILDELTQDYQRPSLTANGIGSQHRRKVQLDRP